MNTLPLPNSDSEIVSACNNGSSRQEVSTGCVNIGDRCVGPTNKAFEARGKDKAGPALCPPQKCDTDSKKRLRKGSRNVRGLATAERTRLELAKRDSTTIGIREL